MDDDANDAASQFLEKITLFIHCKDDSFRPIG